MNGQQKKESAEKMRSSQTREQAIESRERAESESLKIDTLRKTASEVPKGDKNFEYTKRLFELRAELEPSAQLESIAYLQSRLMEVLTRLKRKDKDFDITRLKPHTLAVAVEQNKLPLSLAERTALDEYSRLIRETGPTADYLEKSFEDLTNKADEASKGWTDKLKESFMKEPLKTGLLLAAGAAGIYMGWKLIKSWFSGKESADSESAGDKKASGGWGIGKWLLGGLGIIAAGTALSKKIKTALGIDKAGELMEAIRNGESIPEYLEKKFKEKADEWLSSTKQKAEEAVKGGAAALATGAEKAVEKTKEATKQTEAEHATLLDQALKADVLEFSWLAAKEGGRGALQIGSRLMLTLFETGKVTKDELENVESAMDFMALLFKVGGTLMVAPGKEGLGIITIAKETFVVKPIGIAKETFAAWAEKGAEAGLKTYAISASPFVMIGAAHGILKNKGLFGRTAGALKGALVWSAAPVTVPAKGAWWMIKTGRETAQSSLKTLRWTQEAIRYRSLPLWSTEALAGEANRLADLYPKLQQERGWIQAGKEVITRPGREVRRLIAPEYTARMARGSALSFQAKYNAFFGLESGSAAFMRTPIPEEILGHPTQVAEAIKGIFADATRVTRGIEKAISNPAFKAVKTPGELTQLIESTAEFTEDELIALRSKLLKPGVFSKMKDQLERMGEKMKATPRISAPQALPETLFEGGQGAAKDRLKALREQMRTMEEGAEKTALKKQAQALESYLTPLKKIKKGMDTTAFEKLAPTQQAEEIAHFAEQIEARSIGVSKRVQEEVKAIQEWAKKEGKSLASPEVQKKFIELDRNITAPFAKMRAANLERMNLAYNRLPKIMRPPQLKAAVKSAIRGGETSLATRVKTVGGARLKLGAAIAATMFAVEVFTEDDPEKEWMEMLAEFGPEAGQILVDVLPFVGTGSMLYAAIAGEETVTDRELELSDRLLQGAFGVASLAADVLTVAGAIGGVGAGGVLVGSGATAARLAVLAKKGGRVGMAAEKILLKWPKISSVMSRMGVRKFAETTSKFLKGEKTIARLKTAEKAMTVTGAGVMAGSLAFNFIGGDEITAPDDIDLSDLAQ